MDNIMIAATQNTGKLKELRTITEKFGLELISMAEAGLEDLDIREDGKTFEENAFIKARAVSLLTGEACIADDSGLCVDALGGAPGLLSARFSGTHGDDAANRRKLLKEMEGMEDRKAHFSCAICLYRPGGEVLRAEGICPGHIGVREEGDGGFGYDSVFIPEGYDLSFAQMGEDVKNRISHRARALAELEKLLEAEK